MYVYYLKDIKKIVTYQILVSCVYAQTKENAHRYEIQDQKAESGLF